MGSTGRKEKEKEIRRNDIIDAAEKVIFEKGYDAATMDDIAKTAEFSKRTVYVYFNSKEQIYFEIMIKGYRLMIKRLKDDLHKVSGGPAIEQLRQLYFSFYRFSRDYPDYFDAIMEYENSTFDFQNDIPDQSIQECYALGEQVFGYLSDILKKGVADRSIRDDLSIAKTALTLWSCVLGVFNTARKKENYIKNYHHTKPDDLIADAFDIITRSIRTDEGGD